MWVPLKRFHMPSVAITVVLVLATAVAGVFAWWNNERIHELDGGVPLLPRAEVFKAEKQANPSALIINYAFKSNRSADKIKDFYLNTLQQAGWDMATAEENTLQFKRGKSIIRIVLHPQRLKTVFTLHVRHPAG